MVPVFPQDVQALNNRTVKLEGLMMPLEPGEKQRHFLLSSVPVTCAFCVPAGPEGLVEVRSRTPVKYTLEPVFRGPPCGAEQRPLWAALPHCRRGARATLSREPLQGASRWRSQRPASRL